MTLLSITGTLAILTLWWLNPNTQLQISSLFWLVAIVGFVLYYKHREYISAFPTVIVIVLGMLLLFRIIGQIIPVEQMVIVFLAMILWGMTLSILVIGLLSPREKEMNHQGRFYGTLVSSLILRLMWDVYQVVGGKTSSRFGEFEPIHVFFQPQDWWFLGVGILLAVLLPLIITLFYIIRRLQMQDLIISTGIACGTSVIGQAILLQFITQYGLVF